jgi:xanthine permease XanP
MKRPTAIAYSVEERPPPTLLIATAIQHVGVLVMFLIYPLLVAKQGHLDADEILSISQFGVLVLALAVLLQGLPAGPVGSRFLAPSIFTGVFLAPSLMAVKVGGMPLVWGMTIFAGFIEIVLSRLWTRLRTFAPPEAAGLVMILIGIIIALAALHLVLDHSAGQTVSAQDGVVVAVTLGVMIGLNVWNKGRLKLLCILIGAMAGYVASYAAGGITPNDFTLVLSRPVFAVPTLRHFSWAFDWSMALPFAISGLAAAMSASAVITTYQRLNDAEWLRPEPSSLTRGLLGEGLANIFAGALCTHGLTVSTANVGMVTATGVTSRVIAYAIAAVLAFLAFQPIVIGILTIMPGAVMAGVMIFTATFILLGGINIITSRPLDNRRALVVGMGLLTFLFVTVAPTAFSNAPSWALPIVTSPLVLATLVALAFNALFRIGARRVAEMFIDPAANDLTEISRFIDRNADTWNVRKDLVLRASTSAQQAVVSVIDHCSPNGPIKITASYDEFDIVIQISYFAPELVFSNEAPNREDVMVSLDSHRRLAGYLVARHADQVIKKIGESAISLRFKH